MKIYCVRYKESGLYPQAGRHYPREGSTIDRTKFFKTQRDANAWITSSSNCRIDIVTEILAFELGEPEVVFTREPKE